MADRLFNPFWSGAVEHAIEKIRHHQASILGGVHQRRTDLAAGNAVAQLVREILLASRIGRAMQQV